MMKTVACAFVALNLVMPVARSAETAELHVRTAGDLAEFCGINPKLPEADAKINFCHGFAQAAVDVEEQLAHEKKPFCFPSQPPRRSATLNEFVDWVRALPEHRNQPATTGLFKFLAERFPCK